MTKQLVNIGSSPNSSDGDVIRTAFDKINQNFNELYTLSSPSYIKEQAAGLITDGTHVGITAEFDIANLRLNLTGPTDISELTDNENLLGSGGGSSFDQNLNTTNSVSFVSVSAAIVNASQINGTNPGNELVVQANGHNWIFGTDSVLRSTNETTNNSTTPIFVAGNDSEFNADPGIGTTSGYFSGTGTAADGVILFTDQYTIINVRFYSDAGRTVPYNLPVDLVGAPGGFYTMNTPAQDFNIAAGTGNLTTANITLTANSNTWTFGANGVLTTPGDILPDSDATRSLGSPTRQWKEIFVSTGSIYIGNVKLSNQNGILQINTVEKQINPETQQEEEVIIETESVQFTKTSHLELTNNPAPINFYLGDAVAFTKTDYGSEVDVIDDGLSITRGNQQGIYNPEQEPGWDNSGGDPDGQKSPKNTLWNKDGWADLTNLSARTYVPFYTSVGGQLGNNVLAPLFIMHDVVNNKYYKIDFTVWGNTNNGAPVAYTRQEVDPVTGTDIGGLVTFSKPGYADPFAYYDDIGPGLRISRGSNQGIFNTALETGWNGNSFGDGDGENSPAGTLWNLDGWADLSDVSARTYKPLVEAFDYGLGEKIVGTECVMKDVGNNTYYAIKFTGWTQNGNGGGFSYTRRLINPNVEFVHTTGGSEIDVVILDDGQGAGVGITRGTDGAIYNPYRENSWDDTISPGGTLWNLDGWDDLTDVTSRNYVTFYNVFGQGGIGNKVVGTELVMKAENDTYYKIKFTSWQQGGGGAFSYIRTQINVQGKLNEGIKFADGTVQKTAANNVVKHRASGQRSIQEWCGDKTVEITPAVQYTIDTTVWQTFNNANYLLIRLPTQVYATEFDNRTLRNVSVSLDNGTTWIAVKVNGTGNYGGYYMYVNEPNNASVFTATDGAAVKVRYYRGGAPVIWFDPASSPGGISLLRGAVIDYHAYSQDEGTIVGKIMISRDSGDCLVTHSESTSGGSSLGTVDLWYCDDWNNLYPEGTLAAWRTNGSNDTIKIQWRATMFYGSEYWD